MVRPSLSATLKVSFVNFTAVTRSSAVSAKMPMPSLQQCRLMLTHQFLQPPQLPGWEAEVAREADRLQPEFGRQIVPINMDMGWFIGLMAVKVEAVGAASQDSRHELPIPSPYGVPAAWEADTIFFPPCVNAAENGVGSFLGLNWTDTIFFLAVLRSEGSIATRPLFPGFFFDFCA
jgi:hypothetical protein